MLALTAMHAHMRHRLNVCQTRRSDCSAQVLRELSRLNTNYCHNVNCHNVIGQNTLLRYQYIETRLKRRSHALNLPTTPNSARTTYKVWGESYVNLFRRRSLTTCIAYYMY
eukprot:COSAG02_NODE_1670_length_11394_cov_4.791855_1_plen_111_part_00